jgi:1-aminocyclopropane-1-carboxylate deaminase/D-cysteine desulfhydrase-like pyridoxal-dependent ACC family enzyme
MTSFATALGRLASLPRVALLAGPSPLQEAPRLRGVLGSEAPRILVKRDDAIAFGFGGNKVRKLEFVLADALSSGADTLVTVGGIQSNHARATAAAAARHGLRCVIVANGAPPERPTGNALLNRLLGAEIEYIASREERARAVRYVLERLERAGRKAYHVPLGASTSLGALGFVAAVGELLEQGPAPDVIVHASSSGGTQAGLVVGVVLNGARTRVLGVSADDPATEIGSVVRNVVAGMGPLLGVDGDMLAGQCSITVDDTHVGDGYGAPTVASAEAQELAARTEALFVDHTYTAKALGALLSYVRTGRIKPEETVVFWHTGGQVGLFA